jgi:hypothetical protein
MSEITNRIAASWFCSILISWCVGFGFLVAGMGGIISNDLSHKVMEVVLCFGTGMVGLGTLFFFIICMIKGDIL